jgi:uncharacterized protein YbjT (DUF2867 family)
MAAKTITVVGATGAQGGGLARAILADPRREFRVRVLTRNVNSAPARRLAESGAELVAADLDDPGSVLRVFSGSYGAYCVTFFWSHLSAERELIHAATMARAAKDGGVQHLIWSTLEDTRRWIPLDDDRMPTLQGRYKVPHFDAKGESNERFVELDVPTTFLLTSFYWENLIHFGLGPRRRTDDRLTITFPMDDKKLPGIAAEDIGKCAYAIFKQGAALVGKTIGVAGEHLTCAQMATAMTRALGREVYYEAVSPEVFRRMDVPGAEDLANMFQFKRDFETEFCGARSVETSRALNPSLQTFDMWLADNHQHISGKIA